MQRHNPNPLCPSQAMADVLAVPLDILEKPAELARYSERLPILDEFDLDHLQDPRLSGNLLWFLRTGDLPHPELLFKEASAREPYLLDDPRLKSWVISMMRGCYSNVINTAKAFASTRCSACGSSFFGIALEDHSEDRCGFVRFLPRQHWLEFCVANSYSFCGYCNSRSTSHTRCPSMRPCKSCRQNVGHQHFHGVCDLNLSPLQFKDRVKKLRIRRGRRIRWLVDRGLLAFPLPNDFIPSVIQSQADRVIREGQLIRGTGPLLHPEADELDWIPPYVYRWRQFPGLVNRELDHDKQLRHQDFFDHEAEWFMILENRAREIYHDIRQGDRVPFIMKHAFLIRAPRFPIEIYSPGNEPAVEVLAIEPPIEVPLEQDNREERELQGQAPPAGSTRSSPRSSPRRDSENSSEYSEVDHDIVERYVVNAHNNPPVNHDPFLTESILHVRPEGALLDRIREHMHRYDVIEYDAIWTLEDGSETADWESHREETLRSLILPEIRYTVRNKPGDKFSFGVAKPVIEALSTLTAPDSRDALLGRIETWQLVMTGGWDSTPITESVTTNMLLTYYAHLVDLGAALVGSPRSFTCLVTTVFGFPYNNVCLLIPSYHIFRIPAVVEAVRRWMRAPALSFAVQNAPRDQFPYNVELRAPGQDGAEEEVDPEGEREIARVIYTLDVARIGTHFRENLPTLDIIDILLSNECPGPKNLVIRRIRTIQDTITAANEETESLDNYTAEDLDAYCAFWTAILHALRVFVESGASTSARLSECTMELIHGGETAFELAFPTMRAFHSEALGWWLLWVEKTLVPQLKRVSGLQCSCTFHERQPRNQEDQPEQD